MNIGSLRRGKTLLGRVLTAAVAGLMLAGECLAAPSTGAELFAKAAEGAAETVDHAPWDAMLKLYVKPSSDGINRVDYAAFRSGHHGALKDYIGSLEMVDPRRLGKAEQSRSSPISTTPRRSTSCSTSIP